jgi:hypothetical protein
LEVHCITKVVIVVEQHIWQSACSFRRSQIVLLATKNRFDKPHRCAGATQEALLGEEQRLLMEAHRDDGDETKGLSFVRAGLFRGSRGF